ncbi:MAG: hypothetical protein M3Z29_05250 [Pseudomonadota bacterium]|nr:hypothetical protein [Pseudomonadota bacterium]
MRVRSYLIVISMILLTGCAATVKRSSTDGAMTPIPQSAASKLVLNIDGSTASVGAGDWQDFKLEWKESFSEQAKVAGLSFEMQDGPPKPTGEDGTLLSVYIEDYRFLRPGTRYAVGIMSGNAYIESKLTFSSLKTGATFGSRSANTSSSAWQGIFSAMTNKQVEAIAVDVVGQLASAKAK